MVCQDSESDTQCEDGGKCINSKCQESCSMTSPNCNTIKSDYCQKNQDCLSSNCDVSTNLCVYKQYCKKESMYMQTIDIGVCTPQKMMVNHARRVKNVNLGLAFSTK